MKITIWGTGRVGLSAVETLLRTQTPTRTDLVLYSLRSYKKTEGDLLDLEDALAVSGRESTWNVKATNNPEDMAKSDLVFYCAGGTPTAAEYAEGAKNGVNDRMVQSKKNISMVGDFYAAVKHWDAGFEKFSGGF